MMSQVINSKCQAKNERYSVFCIHTDTDSLSIVDYILLYADKSVSTIKVQKDSCPTYLHCLLIHVT